MVFSMAKLVPTMKTFNILGHAVIFNFDLIGLEPHSKTQTAYDPKTYNSALFSNIENLLIREDKVVVEPSKNGWITPRSSSNFEISNDFGMIPTTRPIYKMYDLEVFFQLK